MRLHFSPAEVILRGCFSVKTTYSDTRLGEKSPGLIFALTAPAKQVQWALFCFLEPAQNLFEKVWESSEKIRQRESEKAMSLPGTLKISYTFIRYTP